MFYDKKSYECVKKFLTNDQHEKVLHIVNTANDKKSLFEFEEWNIICEIIEVKPKAQTKKPTKKNKHYGKYLREARTYGINQLKWEAAKEYCKDRQYKFRILTEDHLKK